MVGDVLENPSVILIEGIRPVAFKRHHADHLRLVDQRNGDLGSLTLANPDVRHVIIRIAQHIIDDLGAAFAHRTANNPLAYLRAVRAFAFLSSVSHLDVPDELICHLIDQTDQQKFVIDQTIKKRGDVVEELIEFENRGDFVPDPDQGAHLACALAQLLINPRVIERDGHMIAEHIEDLFMFAGKIIRLRTLDRQNANDLVLTDQHQWNGDLRARNIIALGCDRQVALILRDLADIDRSALAPGC